MGYQMVHIVWVLVAFSSFVQLVEAQSNFTYSTNPADYDFGWLAAATYASGSEPYCTFCMNALTYDIYYNRTAADKAHGTYWNLTVGTYRCDGVEPNEFWAYYEPTQAIVFGNITQGNLTELLCIDAVVSQTVGVVKLRTCNSSLQSQKWKKDGFKIVSAVPGPGGEEMFMVGYRPDPQTSPTNTIYEFNVTLHSSVPSPVIGYLYAYEFSFLSKKGFVNPSTNRFTTDAVLAIANYTVDAVVNGGFESSTMQAGSDITWSDYTQITPSYYALCGWVIDYGPIDYVKSGLLAPADGSYSVHLNTFSDTYHWGQVSQTIITKAGTEYLLSFFFNGFPPVLQITSRKDWHCSPPYTEVSLEVLISNSTSTTTQSGPFLQNDAYGLQQNFSKSVVQSNAQTFQSLWQQNFISFRALTNVTTISFRSLNFNNSCGPMIDKVALVVVKSKPFWKKTPFQIIIGCVGGVLLLVGILVGVYFGRRRFCAPEEDYSGLYKTENARVFSVKELSSSTKKFSAVLGEGAFGTVYKADFPDGTTGAVKVEKSKHHFQKSSKVLASDEIAVLLRVHHRNLVNLTGFCIHRGRHMLVFEYLPNGSLYNRLHQSVLPIPPDKILDSLELRTLYEKVLPWDKRVKIACDVAYGLEYLHHDADPPIVHRDVKSGNILLTSTDSAKLADFGLSKAAPADATTFESIETLVRGSIGYLDPNYFLTGVFSAKSDVYSYGVVLLELISGHQAIYNAAPLGSWAAPFLTNSSHYRQLADSKLNEKYEFEELESLVELCKMCMQEDSRARPNMRQVVAFLNARRLVVAGSGESAESIPRSGSTISRETYHKMHPLFIDFEAVSTESPGSSDSIFVSPKARD